MIEQRKTVSVLFADLVESTSLAERLDPETLAGILRRFSGALRAAIEAHGGTVEKFIGDAVVGVFGVPVLHEDDALRAVRAALDIHKSIDELNADLQPRFGISLAVRIGVNTGPVAVGAEGALGHAMSMAARLEQAAKAGKILIGRETFALVEGWVEAEQVGPLTVKGSTEPLAAWRVTAVVEQVPRGSRAGTGFVGRERELGAIESAFEAAVRDNACVTLTLVAPPGLGKSRLAAEGASRVGERARVLVGRCQPYGESITYAPLIEAVAQLEAGEGSDALDRHLASQRDGEQVAARIRATVAGAAHGSPDETAWAFRRLFDVLAEERPLILLLDDLHWAEPLLLDLIEYLGTFSVGRPILLLCAARPDLFDTRPGWSAPRSNALQLRLEPLTPSETEGLLTGIGTQDLDASARQRIVEASGGVPLFAEQMAAFEAEAGSDALVPPTIRALLAARVDRLAPEERTVLERAAIEGETFTREALTGLMPDESRGGLGAHLMTLIRREFIRPERVASAKDAFSFSHALIRDAVHDQMPREVRAALHERYAEFLEGTGTAAPEVVGHHLDQAYRDRVALGGMDEDTRNLALRAGLALHAAGRRAIGRQESRRAIELLRRADELLRGDPSARVAAMPDVIDALVALPEFEEADVMRAEAVALSRTLGDLTSELRAEIAWARSEYLRDAEGWQDRAVALAERAVGHFGATGDDASIARALLLKAFAQAGADPAAMLETLREAQAHAQVTDDEQVQVMIWDELGGAMLMGRTPYTEVLELVRREIAWARERGIAFAEADGRLGEAYVLASLGEFDAARETLESIRVIFAALPGLVSQYGETYILGGLIEREAGDPSAAEGMYRHAIELFEQGGNRPWWRGGMNGLAHALIDLDRLPEARTVLDQLATERFTTQPRAEAFRLEAEARYLARGGDAAAAIDVARDAVALLADTDGIYYAGRARETLASLLNAAGEGTEARHEYELARDLYEEKGFRPGVERITAILEELSALRS